MNIKDLNDLLNKYDTNENGILELNELKKICEVLNLDMYKLNKEIELGKNETLSKERFIHWYI